MGTRFIMIILSLLLCASAWGQEYHADNGWVVGHNVARYNNRPIYLHNTNAFILAGDKPVIRIIRGDTIFGTICFLIQSGDAEKKLELSDDILSMYRGGRMKWVIRDRIIPDTDITVELIPDATEFGCQIRMDIEGGEPSASLKWTLLQGERRKGHSLSWDLDVMTETRILDWGADDDSVPVSAGTVDGSGYLSALMNDDRGLDVTAGGDEAFGRSVEALDRFNERLRISTPDPCLDAMAEASLFAVDGCWSPPAFVHGCMLWRTAIPGWRVMSGGTVYGWHDRILEAAKYYIESQVTESDKVEAKADSTRLYCVQSKESRFYGEGRIMKNQGFYDMQSQFFDQLVEEYRWNPSPELVRILRPALERHLKWIEDCFDPDGDGLYESYINSWPTDSQWYNGGGTAEETSYAYRGHLAAYDMAVSAGDSLSAAHHRQMLGRIKKGFSGSLWLGDEGYSGSYIEQGGYGRVHKNPWLYSIFLPIDAGLTGPLESIQSLYYTEWALQNEVIPGGGRMVWTSNWLPSVWSVRVLWPGDNYHLALSYCQAGMPDNAYELAKGTFMHTGFQHTVPANFGAPQGGTDFADCLHPFARFLVSGLFGYRPDYPKGEVHISPSFPTDWDHARIQLPDYGLNYRRTDKDLSCDITLSRPASMTVSLPVGCRKVRKVLVNGSPVDYEVLPKAGGSLVRCRIGSTGSASVKVLYSGHEPYHRPQEVVADVHSECTVALDSCRILSLNDPQGIFENYEIEGDRIIGRVSGKTGYHTAVAEVISGSCRQWRVLHVRVDDREAEAARRAASMEGEDMGGFEWHTCDISGSFNADVREIYRQSYLSPRPNTVSVRIGSNGYSPWTFTYWHSPVPDIKLDKAGSYLKYGELQVPQGVRYRWSGDEKKNVSFVSLWDNYPDEMVFDTGDAQGDCISFLVCGSTNMMQCDIANAEIVIRYADGGEDTLQLIPPYNYWNLSPIDPHISSPGQIGCSYYTAEQDRFCLHGARPATVELGENCTAMVLNARLKPATGVRSITLRCLSQEVVVGLMGISFGTSL